MCIPFGLRGFFTSFCETNFHWCREIRNNDSDIEVRLSPKSRYHIGMICSKKINPTLLGTFLLSVALLSLGTKSQLYSQETNGDLAMLSAIEDNVSNVIESASQSVVAIARIDKDDLEDPTSPDFVPKEFGTGVAIGEAGLVLTCYHILGDPAESDYYVWISGVPFKVREVEKVNSVMAADPWTDLAVLKIDAKLKPIRFAQDFKPRRGQFVISLGNPFGIARDGNASASFGIVSNLLRERSLSSASELDNTRDTYSQYGTLLQTDAKLNRGTSGGPILNLKGEMIGLSSSLAAADRFDESAGFAIPVDQTFIRTIDRLKKGRSADFGFLGIATRELTLAQRQLQKKGVVVTQVVDNTPADVGGLKFGDIITHIQGKEIASSNALLRELSGRFAEDEITISIERRPFPKSDIRKIELKVRLGKKKVSAPQPTIGINDFSAWRGIKVDYPTAIDDLAIHHSKIDKEGCVAIVLVERGSLAEKAGLKVNDFVSHVGSIRIQSPSDFANAIRGKNGPVVLGMTSEEDGFSDGKRKKKTIEIPNSESVKK